MAEYDAAAIRLGDALCSYFEAEAKKKASLVYSGTLQGNRVSALGRSFRANFAVDMQAYDGRSVFFLPTTNGEACIVGS